MFRFRSNKLERIDTGDYSPDEYRRFLREIAFINRYVGDRKALKNTLFRDIDHNDPKEFSVLDVGSGSGELLRTVAEYADKSGRRASLTGIDLNPISASTTRSMSSDHPSIASVRGDAFALPFDDAAFDYAISSLFFHHLTDAEIPFVLREMRRVSRLGVFIIDLHRHPVAYAGYKLFCAAFGISRLVRHDGSVSVLRGFKASELQELGGSENGRIAVVTRHFPYRLVMRA